MNDSLRAPPPLAALLASQRALIVGAFGGAIGLGLGVVVAISNHEGFDATTAAWVQGVGSILALLGTGWTVARTARLGREQMADAQRREEWTRAEARIKDLEQMISLVEVSMAAAIGALVFVEEGVEELKSTSGRRKIVHDEGVKNWLESLDHHSRVIERIPFYTLGNAIAAIAIVHLLRYLATFRSHAVIALSAERLGVDRSDVLDKEHIGIKLIRLELEQLTNYRDALRLKSKAERDLVKHLRGILP